MKLTASSREPQLARKLHRVKLIKIILETTRSMPYSSALYCANLPSLQQRRDQQAREFFLKSILRPDPCLHRLLSAPHHEDLRVPRKFPAVASPYKKIPVTHKFQSPALSVIFILNLHIVHCLLCFRLFLCIFVCTC